MKLRAEIQGHIAHFLGLSKDGPARRWQSVLDRLDGKPGGIADAELAKWLADARRWRWRRGTETLPKVIAALEEESDASAAGMGGADPAAVDRPGAMGGGAGDRVDDEADWRLSDTRGQAHLARHYDEALRKDKVRLGNVGSAIAGHVQKWLSAESRYCHALFDQIPPAPSLETVAEIDRLYGLPCWGAKWARERDRERAEQRRRAREREAADACRFCHRKIREIVPDSCEMRRDCIGAPKVTGLAFVNVTFHGPFLVFETPDPTGEYERGGIPWVFGQGEFQYRDERHDDWKPIDLSKVPGRYIPPWIGQDAHAMEVPPWCEHFRLRMRYRNSDWCEAAISRHPVDTQPHPGLRALWEGDHYEPFGNDIQNATCVNGADYDGNTLAHLIAASDGWSRYAYLMSLCRIGGVNLRHRNRAGQTVLDVWRANEADMALVDGKAITDAELVALEREMQRWPSQ